MRFPSELPSYNPDPDDNPCVHSTHCCALHGCKYGDDDCPVANKTKQQHYLCETCDYVLKEYDEFVRHTPPDRIRFMIQEFEKILLNR
jgi:hypothetical protein